MGRGSETRTQTDRLIGGHHPLPPASAMQRRTYFNQSLRQRAAEPNYGTVPIGSWKEENGCLLASGHSALLMLSTPPPDGRIMRTWKKDAVDKTRENAVGKSRAHMEKNAHVLTSGNP